MQNGLATGLVTYVPGALYIFFFFFFDFSLFVPLPLYICIGFLQLLIFILIVFVFLLHCFWHLCHRVFVLYSVFPYPPPFCSPCCYCCRFELGCPWLQVNSHLFFLFFPSLCFVTTALRGQVGARDLILGVRFIDKL